MDWPLAIVCYHRVLPETERSSEGRPYFARGTAVSDVNFAAQLRALRQRFDLVSATNVLGWLAGERSWTKPSCWLTFDDGYRDLLRVVAPLLDAAGVPATAFVTTAVAEGSGRWLPADRWYATLNRATARRGVLADADGRPREFDLDLDYARFVDGPERRRCLAAAATEQDRTLVALADALGVGDLSRPEIYLDWGDIARLASMGWSIGGHGATHAILTSVPTADAAAELATCRRMLRSHDLPGDLFAYPDGACNRHVAAAAKDAGWRAAVVLENRVAELADGPFALPRFIPADDPAWVDRALVPVYTASASQQT